MTRVKLFEAYEKFMKQNLFSPRTSLGTTLDSSNVSNLVSKKKMIIIMIIRLLAVFFIIRAVVAVTLPKTMTKHIICEFFHVYGNPTPIHIGLSAGAVCGNFLCGNPFQYTIYKGRSKIFEFMDKVKNDKLDFKLNVRSEKKFKLWMQVISFLCLQLAPNAVLAIIYWNIGIVAVYMKEDYNLIGVIFSSMVVSAYIYDFFATLVTISSTVLISAIFFKIQFQQMNQEFRKIAMGILPNRKLPTLIKLHNSIILEVERFDSENNYYLYVLVKLIKPAFNTFVYLLIEPHTTWHFLPYAVATVAVNSLFFVGITNLFAAITKFAHRPQFSTYDLLLSRRHNTTGISLNVRLKAMRFIERLSGRVIGFYVFNLFPMTTYQFTDYILDSMVSFLLIIKFLERLGFI